MTLSNHINTFGSVATIPTRECSPRKYIQHSNNSLDDATAQIMKVIQPYLIMTVSDTKIISIQNSITNILRKIK